MKHYILLLLILFFACKQSLAQLPSIDVKVTKGRVEIFWVSQYNGIESITVQRSNDPKTGYVSIGSLVKQNRGPQKYIDESPLLGNSYYRLLIVFESEIEWFSDVKNLYLDSTAVIFSKNNTSADINSENESNTIKENNIVVKPVFSFTPSSKVFTDPVTGHVNIVLTDAISKRYSLEFFDANKKAILTIDRISKSNIVLDKHNINRKGNVAFKLYDAGKEIETGFVNLF